MKKLLHLSGLSLAALVLLSGCHLKEKYSKNNADGRAWLEAAQTGPARTSFEGVFYSPEWGAVVLNQNGNKLTGAVAHMSVDGVVSGRTASLLLVDDTWVEYTMKLRRKSYEEISGTYSAYVPYSETDALPVTLYRISQ
ncbi:MAG: hypothetical protein SFU53_16040 [Terrimicrobiaceae bacterium]|nr:hypothetical protein [Terrimicrobiaceae bacterium]